MGIEARTIGLRLGVIGVGLLLLCAFASSSMAADLKIGFTFSLTGGTDDAGKGARMGAELALAEYNERGGYKGQKVEAIIYDVRDQAGKGRGKRYSAHHTRQGLCHRRSSQLRCRPRYN